jgi:gliding motility-associated-like protein
MNHFKKQLFMKISKWFYPLSICLVFSFFTAQSQTLSPIFTLKRTTGEQFMNVLDFDSDGIKDLIVGHYSGNRIDFYKNTGTSYVLFTSLIGTPSFAYSGWAYDNTNTFLQDFDGDGRKDLLINFNDAGWCTTNSMRIYWGVNTATLFDATVFTVVHSCPCCYPIVTDFNGDNRKDIVIEDPFGNNIVYRNNGTRVFTNVGTYVTPRDVQNISLDFNNDGKEDMVAIDAGFSPSALGGMYVWRGNGDGTFQTPLIFEGAGETPIADILKVNNRSVAYNTSRNNGKTLYVRNNSGLDSCQILGTNAFLIGNLDYNNDGFLDLVVVSDTLTTKKNVTVHIANSSGSFCSPNQAISIVKAKNYAFNYASLSPQGKVHLFATSPTNDSIFIFEPILCVPPSVSLTASSTNLCSNATLTATTAQLNVQYKWSKDGVLLTGQTGAALQVSQIGSYSVKVTNLSGCDTTLTKVFVLDNSCRCRDSLALIDFYNATGGPNWTRRDNWLTSSPISTWYGIQTDANGCVTCIDLDGNPTCTAGGNGNNLVGRIPSSLDSLKNLKGLFLSKNQLNDTIPNLILPELQFLWLDNNIIGGTIPNFNLQNLQTLILSENFLTGTIPNFNLPKLSFLSLQINRLTGAIPNFNLPNLRYLYLNGNQLSGSVPNFNLPNLERFAASTNLLTVIPSFNLLSSIQFLDLASNRILGTIPNFSMLTLKILSLSQNKLDGAIPNFNLPNLEILALSNNQLTGTVPNFNLPNLQVLHFYQNRIDSCPRFTDLPSIQPDAANATRGLRSNGNKLTFDDILPNIRFATSATFIYTTQDSIFKDTTYNAIAGGPLSINLNIDDTVTTNVYKWYKNNVLYRTVNGVNKLIFNTLQVSDAGVYRCEVSNPNAPLLTLYSRRATVTVTCIASNNSRNAAICAGQTYTLPSGRIVSLSGIYRDTLRNVLGCDSIITVTLSINQPSSTSLSKSICSGRTYTLPSGRIVSVAGIYKDTLKNVSGCDSTVITTTLSINNPSSTPLSKSICFGQTYTLSSGRIVSLAGTYRDTLRNVAGCDSVITTTLSVNQVSSIPLSKSICFGQTYTLPSGRIVSLSGIYRDTFRNASGCDSIIATTLSVNQSSSTPLSKSICVGGTYTLPKGRIVSVAGVYRDTFKNSSGCDSLIIITTLTISNTAPKALNDTYTLLQGQSSIDMNVIANDIVRQLGVVSPLQLPSRGQLEYIGNGVFRYTAPNVTSAGTITYIYRVCDNACPNLCDSATVSVTLSQNIGRNIPVGITPNGDGANDVLDFNDLGINTTQYPDNEITIVNRWSQIVFQTKQYDNNWAGNNQDGKPLPAGTYYYIFRLNLADGKIITGDITIVR